MADLLRKRNFYAPSSAGPPAAPGEESVPWTIAVDLPPVGRRNLDFGRFRRNGRDDLARHFRDAVYQELNKLSPKTVCTLGDGLALFFRFLDESKECRRVCSLNDVGGDVLKKYLAWLRSQYPKGTTQARVYSALMTVLTNRSTLAPEAVHPDLLEGRLPKNVFPHRLRNTDSWRPYSESEQRRVANAAGKDLLAIKKGEWQGRDADVVAVALLALALRTGWNSSSLLGLRRGCIATHPVKPDREVLTCQKRRGYSTHRLEFERPDASGGEVEESVSVLKYAGEIVRMLERRCDELSPEVAPELGEFLVLYRKNDRRVPNVRRLRLLALTRRLQVFVKRHKILDDHGKDLKLRLARIRPTCAASFQRISGGNLLHTAKILGQSSLDIASRHYLGTALDDHLDFQLLQRSMVNWVSPGHERKVKIVEGRPLLPENDAVRLFQGKSNTSVARCSDPYHGEKAPKDGCVCQKTLECFACPNMVVFRDDLHRLLSFYETVVDARHFLTSAEWAKTYAWIVRLIDEEILPKFDPGAVEAARTMAKQDPHPVWVQFDVEEGGVYA